jgi:hypothetical protein
LKYGEGWDDRVLIPLRQYLRSNGENAGSVAPSEANAKQGAKKLLGAAKPIFLNWIKSGAHKNLSEENVKTAIKSQLEAEMPTLVSIYGGVKNYDEIGDTIYSMLTDHFALITVTDIWFQFGQFKTAWYSWLEANAKFTWQNEKPLSKIEAALLGLGISRRNSLTGKRRACQVLERFGAIFSLEMKQNVLEDKAFATDEEMKNEALRIFNLAFTDNILSDLGIDLKHKEDFGKIFLAIYPAYFDVTIKLWKVVLRLSKLHSIYPPATLHDCDDGNDDNPVRLGSTMLGG